MVSNIINSMSEAKIKIEGMSCQHCVMRVRKAIESVSGVEVLGVDVGEARVRFDASKTSLSEIENAISKAGYKVIKG